MLVLPRLEEPLARHELGELADELEIVPWDETDDPIRAVQALVGRPVGSRSRTRCGRASPFASAPRSIPPSWCRPARR